MLKKKIDKVGTIDIENICVDIISIKVDDNDPSIVTEVAVAIFAIKRYRSGEPKTYPYSDNRTCPTIGKIDYQIITFKTWNEKPKEISKPDDYCNIVWEWIPLSKKDIEEFGLLSDDLRTMIDKSIYEFFDLYYKEEDPDEWSQFVDFGKHNFVEPFYEMLFSNK